MPFKRTFKKKFTTKKRTYKRSTAPAYKAVAISRGIATGFPKIFKIKHRYVEQVIMTSTATPVNVVFSCNSLFKPSLTPVSHQPLWFDTVRLIYNHYTVIGSRIKIMCMPVDGVDEARVISLTVDDDGTISNNINTLQEQGRASQAYLAQNSNRVKTLTKSWSMRKNWGKGATLANSLMRGDGLTSPEEQQYYVVTLASLDGASTTRCLISVQIEYIAVWNELKNVVGS